MTSRVFLIVAAVILLDGMLFAVLSPLLPYYASKFHLSDSAVGALSGSYATGSVLATIPGAFLAGRFHGRQLVVLGAAILAVSTTIFAFGQVPFLLYSSRFAQGVGSAFAWIGGLSWLVSTSDQITRGTTIGSTVAIGVTGVMLGPALGVAATAIGTEIVFVAVGSAALALACTAAGGAHVNRHFRPDGHPRWSRLPAREVAGSFALVCLPAAFSGALLVLVALRLDGLGAGATIIGLVFIGAALVEAVVSKLSGWASDKVGRERPIRFGLMLSLVGASGMGLPGRAFVVVASMLVSAIGIGLMWAPAASQLSDTVETRQLPQTFAFTIVNLAWAAGQMVGATGAGYLIDTGPDWIPYLCLVSLFGAALVMMRLFPESIGLAPGRGAV